ncbi:MAG: hypothetical protein RH982_06515 [Parvibaculum sp.]
MTISDTARYCGSVLYELANHFGEGLVLRPILPKMQGIYLVNGRVPLYIKFSRSRKGPWTFNFHHEHQRACQSLAEEYGDCITVFVCGADGAPAVNYLQLREILDHNFDEQEAVSVRRKLRHMYAISGKDGRLANRVGRGSLITLIEAALIDSEAPQ